MKKKVSLIVKNAAELVTLDSPTSRGPHGGAQMRDLNIIPNGAVAVDGTIIIETGPTRRILDKYQGKAVIDAAGGVVTPGLVDPHTHLVFAGDRSKEFEMHLQGASYQEIAAAGGGIKSTVKATRAATKPALKDQALPSLQRFLAGGTTTVEAKSGYGLSLEDEIKILEVIRDLNKAQPVELVPTFLGAHDVPEEYRGRTTEYVKLLINRMLPEVARRKLAKFCDIFCEKGVFEIAESRQVLAAAQKYGFQLKVHADEFAPLGGAELAAELSAVSADHLMAVSEPGIRRMKEAGVIPVLLPGTTFALGLTKYAPARRMIAADLPVALATDFNPGTSFTESLPLVMTLACVMMRMTPAETLTAATINAAYALGRGSEIGNLVSGKQADLVIWPVPSYHHICYHFGVNLAGQVIKRGKVVARNI